MDKQAGGQMKKYVYTFTLIAISLFMGSSLSLSSPNPNRDLSVVFFDHEDCQNYMGHSDVYIDPTDLNRKEIQKACEEGFSDGPYRNIDSIMIGNSCFSIKTDKDYSLIALRDICLEKILKYSQL
jgi:hypothetical protein